MGASGSKNSTTSSRFSAEELTNLDTAFHDAVLKHSGELFIQQETFKVLLTKILPQKLVNNFCSIIDDGKHSPIRHANKPRLIPWTKLLVFVASFLKGNSTEHCQILMKLADPDCRDGVTGLAMSEFITEISEAYFRHIAVSIQNISWAKGVSTISPKAFSRYLLSELFDKDISTENILIHDPPSSTMYSVEQIEDWQSITPIAATIITTLFRAAFNLEDREALNREAGRHTGLLPLCTGTNFSKFQSLLSIPDIALINQHLPSASQDMWRYLFSTRQFGDSFSQLLTKILDKGPTVLVVRDKNGWMFGGFASHSWKLQPQFAGNDSCFLFSLYPRAGIYNTTGYNDHYMYLNTNQQTMPNGLGMGGQLNYFGLWIDNDYGKGLCAKSCTTFKCPQLSSTLEFIIDSVEVWGVGPEPKSDTEGQRSVLDKVDPELKAILEMSGKAPISDAIREADAKVVQET